MKGVEGRREGMRVRGKMAQTIYAHVSKRIKNKNFISM
jgi:hypothetical protein